MIRVDRRVEEDSKTRMSPEKRNTKRTDADGRVPAAELEVLAVLKRRGTATAREIREALAAFRPLTHASVATLLGRLEARGLVSRERGPVGKAFVYAPAEGARSPERGVLADLLLRVFGGSGVALVASLFETRPPTPGEIAELEALLERHKRERRSRKGKNA